ncbi:MAG: hypothetical protein MUC86_01775 [Burkholderiaceae bacterium]|jgi:hypothetical protein|nr:hypothetical protein [Burkholderiaceae bacterium]
MNVAPGRSVALEETDADSVRRALLNTARGSSIDEAALVRALGRGTVYPAAIDALAWPAGRPRHGVS